MRVLTTKSPKGGFYYCSYNRTNTVVFFSFVNSISWVPLRIGRNGRFSDGASWIKVLIHCWRKMRLNTWYSVNGASIVRADVCPLLMEVFQSPCLRLDAKRLSFYIPSYYFVPFWHLICSIKYDLFRVPNWLQTGSIRFIPLTALPWSCCPDLSCLLFTCSFSRRELLGIKVVCIYTNSYRQGYFIRVHQNNWGFLKCKNQRVRCRALLYWPSSCSGVLLRSSVEECWSVQHRISSVALFIKTKSVRATHRDFRQHF